MGRVAVARVVAAVAIAAVLVATSCGRPPTEELRADLCGDLSNLGPTLSMLVEPPVQATVGQLRGGLEKLDPTFAGLRDSELVPEPLLEALLDAQSEYRLALKPHGDDEPGAAAIEDAAGSAIDLGVTVGDVRGELRCDQFAAEP